MVIRLGTLLSILWIIFLFPQDSLSFSINRDSQNKISTAQSQPITIIHIVKENENLWTIAKTFDTKVSKLVKLNQLKTPDLIFPGSRLVIEVKDEFSPETPVPSSIQIGSINKGIQILVRNAPLVDVFQQVANETNIQFRFPNDLTAMRLNADIIAADWNVGVQTLLDDYNHLALFDKHGKLSEVVLLKYKPWMPPRPEAKEKKLWGQSVRTQVSDLPSTGTRKNPSFAKEKKLWEQPVRIQVPPPPSALIASDIVLSKAQLLVLAQGPYRSPLPTHLFDERKYRKFLARHGIESLEDLKVIVKAKSVRRAARNQLKVHAVK